MCLSCRKVEIKKGELLQTLESSLSKGKNVKHIFVLTYRNDPNKISIREVRAEVMNRKENETLRRKEWLDMNF